MTLADSITIANVRGTPREADLRIYCGRGEAPRGLLKGDLGNPFTVHTWGRGTAIAKFDSYLMGLPPDSRPWKVIRRIAQRVNEGKSIQLFCWCAPAACHCDVIKREILASVQALRMV